MQMALSEEHISELILAKNYGDAFEGIVKLYGERMYWQISMFFRTRMPMMCCRSVG